MTAPGGEIRALRQVVREARESEPAQPDWSAMEQRLLHELDRRPTRRALSRTAIFGAAGVAVAGVAAGLLTLRALDKSSLELPPTVASAASDRLDGNTLPVGRRLVAGSSAIHVQHLGHAQWTVEPHSSAWLAERDRTIVVQLEFGSVTASVVPAPVPESFVVQVGGTRVAVHGTVFSVAATDGGVSVRVTQGTVAVSAISGSKPAWLLSAPASGRFTLAGERLDTLALADASAPRPAARITRLTPTLPLNPIGAPSADPAPPAPSAAAESSESGLPEQPEPLALELAAGRIADVVRSCFANRTHSSGGVSVMATTQMTAFFAASGKTRALSFDPPLAPAVQDCAESSIEHVVVEPSTRGGSATVTVDVGG